MNAVDGSEHYERQSDGSISCAWRVRDDRQPEIKADPYVSVEPPPALLTIILDTSPYAWSALKDTLPLSKAVANIIVFINAHLAFNYANKVAVIASHSQRACWLYPSPPEAVPDVKQKSSYNDRVSGDIDGDVEMTDSKTEMTKPNGDQSVSAATNGDVGHGASQANLTAKSVNDANKYRPFRLVEDEVLSNLRHLISDTDASTLDGHDSTAMAGAMSLALAYINRQILLQADRTGTMNADPSSTGDMSGQDPDANLTGLQSRILVISVSSDQADQYIPIMNCIFAAQRKRIPIDVLKIAANTAFLQQAADATRGIYMHPSNPQGLLQYLMMAFLSDQTSRRHLVPPTQVNVDFRAACFCHKRVVDVGFFSANPHLALFVSHAAPIYNWAITGQHRL
ncbi:MAG: hypothetical protein M4579_001160 [Chaenotheca gracillima]|nr:MAG: hypothetical protein M4579_001160 [Chaenotheca gracillima]